MEDYYMKMDVLTDTPVYKIGPQMTLGGVWYDLTTLQRHCLDINNQVYVIDGSFGNYLTNNHILEKTPNGYTLGRNWYTFERKINRAF